MRVFYEITPGHVVRVVAVGKKDRNVLRIGKREPNFGELGQLTIEPGNALD
jgi:hypothetical protein